MTKKLKVNFFNDPGHGWGRVKKSVLRELGIADRISHYSYENGDSVYLEEDCDFPLFFATAKQCGYEVEVIDRWCDGYSRVRSFRNYKNE